RPKLFFKGGTSLSKGFGLIQRFSEDIDIVISRAGLGIRAADDPLHPDHSKKKREEKAAAATVKCSAHVLGKMREKLEPLLPDCTIEADDGDRDQMSLRIRYPTLLKSDPYLKPWVKVECGARGAYEPDVKRDIVPYIQDELGQKLDLAIKGVTLITAERTFWEKAL
ncbi:unnamed protein product, partial [Phaeothamnion confervicola]